MPRLELAFLPPIDTPDVAVVVDVLRMTTTAAALFDLGLSELIIVADDVAAREAAQAAGALLIGERQGVPLPGFDHGNSPLEFSATAVSGRSAVLCTTNGSKAVEAAAAARHLLLGAIVNDRAVAERALELAQTSVTIVCSGTNGLVSLEDVLGAGCIIQRMLDVRSDLDLSDSARIALQLVAADGDLEAAMRTASHADTLAALGFGADISFAARRGSLPLVVQRSARRPARFAVSY